jgi:ribonuclease BN (tRNA processing enzyme)
MVYLKFLGTGGGRFTTTTQKRATGGFYVELDNVKIYVDPGPGALVHAIREKVNLSDLDILFVSHNHLDHANDAAAIIEAMTRASSVKRGTVIGSVSVIDSLDEYHKNLVECIEKLRPGDKIKVKSLELIATKALHPDPTTIGFVLRGKTKILGYTADSVYFEGFAEQFKECDIIIINCATPRNPWKHAGVEKAKHMDAFDVIKLLKIAKPQLALLTHYGVSMLHAKPERVARFIERKSGVETKAIKDFQEFEV